MDEGLRKTEPTVSNWDKSRPKGKAWDGMVARSMQSLSGRVLHIDGPQILDIVKITGIPQSAEKRSAGNQ